MACISMMALLWPLKEVHLSLIPYREICKAHLLEISWRLWPRRRYWTEGNAKWEIQLWKHAVTTSLVSGKTQVKFLSLFIPYALTEIRCCAALAWLGKVTTMIRLQRLKTQLWQKHGPSRVPKEIIFFSNETGKYGEMTTNIDHWQAWYETIFWSKYEEALVLQWSKWLWRDIAVGPSFKCL